MAYHARRILVVGVVLASLLITGGVGAQEPGRSGDGSEMSVDEPAGGGALVITHSDDVLIDGPGQSSDIILRDPGTTDDWIISGGQAGDFDIFDPTGVLRMTLGDGPGGSSIITGRDDVRLNAVGDDGDIFLNVDQDQTVVSSFGNTTPVTEVLRLRADVPPQQVFQNTTSSAEWFFAMTADDQFKISRAGTGKVEAKFFNTGNLQIAGTLIQGSDENAKTDLAPVDTAAILDALAELEISTWEYTAQPGVTHLGPTAQAFAHTFGLGDTSTGIASVDADGIALAAIQALVSQNAELAAANADQDAEIAKLVARIESLEADS